MGVIEEEVEFERVHGSGPRHGRDGKRRARPTIAKFSSFKVKEKVKYSAKLLTGTSISVTEQFSPEVSRAKKKTMATFQRCQTEWKKSKSKCRQALH